MAASLPVPWATAFLDVSVTDQPAAERFWLSATGTTLSSRRGPDGEFVTFLPPSGDAYLRLQRVAAGAGGIHLDLHTIDPPALAERAASLGAATTYADPDLVVLRSPGGMPFCAVELHEAGDVPPATILDGVPSRLDQVCLDCPPGTEATELTFWAALTGWGQVPCSSPEFTLLRPPAGTPRPLQLLLQRLGDGACTGVRTGVRAHLDVAAGTRQKRRTTVAAHERFGARRIGEGRAWTVLAAPGGATFCLTDRDPDTGLG